MASCVVDCVDTDSIDAQFLELGDITRATSLVRDGVCDIGGSSRLIINTANVESAVPGEES